ncbi:tetratricopeptide repeat protein [Desulfoprunum benzoelyticum]|uniref:Tetratricopeptide (TPR) repeat protein n=1 Tax=Desulfoprunum benzoelyticum TaxID=1506996 RepID=A0A840UQR4_9BACT|nr:tetratricopeptide repeat protein [Desulfoprunum benzoelyticum]MBB5346973.1 tetratricopeptide (TPR) repeat protein [Desulfoprunum benzoelyticum]MBM9531009.1 tetratricopeptide repeat protein [Desulfoprunum benzoelyticum]
MSSLQNIFMLALVSLLFGGLLVRADPSLASTNKERVNASIRKAESYSRQGNNVAALKIYNQAITMYPGNTELYYGRAAVWGRAGQYGRALKDLSVVMNRAGRRYPHAVRFRADCYMALGYMQKAVEDYKTFLRKAPEDGKVWSYLAEAYTLMGRRDLALQAIRKGLATNSHWDGKLRKLQQQIMVGEPIQPHKPFSN